jgi:hypothetical protein
MAIVTRATSMIALAICPATVNLSPKAKSALPDKREAGAKHFKKGELKFDSSFFWFWLSLRLWSAGSGYFGK